MGGACSSCFDGIVRPKPKRLRSLTIDKVASYEQALQLDRPEEGTWQPSQKAVVPLPPGIWSSPVPRRQLQTGPPAPAGDFELVIEDLDTDVAQRQLPTRRDATAPKRSQYELEQLFMSPGSLPKPMLPDEREAAIRGLQPTATYEMLSKVPRELLEARSVEAQDLRRKLVRGATIVFVSAGYPGKRFIFEQAAALGVKSVIIDHPDSWSKNLVAEGIVAKFLPVDMSQSSEGVYSQAEVLIRQLGNDGVTGAVDAITTFVELSVPLAARLCEAFGLPGPRPASVDAARDKHRTRASLAAAGLPTPRNMLVQSEADLPKAAALVGFPAVLKPVSGAASLGVKKVVSAEDLRACYREVAAELGSLVVSSGALVKATNGTTGVNASSVVDLTVLLEQYLDGKEVDVDIVMSDGEWQYAAVSDNGPTVEPYFNETWGICPSLLSKEEQTGLKDLAVRSCQALGFTSGIFHVECKYTSSGPQLIEVNARMGGGPVRECNRLVWGVDLVEEALFCALGIPARPEVPELPLTCVGYSLVNARRSGVVRSTSGIDRLRSRKDVLSADPLVAVGDKVVGPADGLPTWLCLLVVSSKTSKEALEYVLRLESELGVEID